jgi:GT2 family glycosyltransferase
MRASIIIPTCDRTEALRRCLRSVVPQLPTTGECEVIVTDDGNSLNSRQMVTNDFPEVRWVAGPRSGPAANRNSGARQATEQWLLFLDDDLEAAGEWLSSYLSAFASGDGKMIFEGCIFNDRHSASLLWEAPLNLDGKISFYCSANFAVSRRLFDQLEGFDERYLNGVYAEDVEFGARARAVGAQFTFLKEAAAMHPLRKRPSALKLAKRWEGKLIYAHDQGASPFRLAWNTPWHALRIIQWRLGTQPMSGENARAAWLFLQEWLWVFWLAPGWVRKWSVQPRSRFWKNHVAKHGPVPKYGF